MSLAVGALCCREACLLTSVAARKLMRETVGNKNSEITREVQTALERHISQRLKKLSQVLQYLQSELFPRLSKDTVTKIILRL
jgi:hypothetical protein